MNKKLTKTQEQDLIKAKEERLSLINIISKEKEVITKKCKKKKNVLNPKLNSQNN